jgi:hypothetical protein
MNIEDQIKALLAEAEPLRSVPDDDPLAAKLARIVDEINALRNGPVKVNAKVEGEDPAQAWEQAVKEAKKKK